MSWKENLVTPLLEIAYSGSKLIRIVSGPGTGKTTAIKKRVARLLEEGINPNNILVITFTRMAARDIERELSMMSMKGISKVQKGTLHSFCFKLLNQSDILRIINRIPRPLFQFEERFLLEDLSICDDRFHEHYFARKKRLRAFEAAWAREQDQKPGWPSSEIDKDFNRRLEQWLIFHQAILIGELVPLTLRYLRNNPNCSELVNLKHVIVDEYQDLNKSEQTLVDLISYNASLLVAGDEDQSIYEDLRFAHPQGISDFDKNHNGTEDHKLEICKRCPPNIVILANELIQRNSLRKKRNLLPNEENPDGNVFCVQWNNLEEEIEGISEYISSNIHKGKIKQGDIIVLSPRKQFGYLMKSKLKEKGIPSKTFFSDEMLEGNPKNEESCKAQEAFTLLNLLLNPNDLVALRCWLGFGSNSLQKNEYYRLKRFCLSNDISIRNALEQTLEGNIIIEGIFGIKERFNILMKKLKDIQNLSDRQKFNMIFPEDEEWSIPFNDLIAIGEDFHLKDIFESIKSAIIQPELPTEVDYVRIMSLHKSKGLNVENVVIIDCIEGVIPSYPKNEEDLSDYEKYRYREEQRRIFYVAITRAKRLLILSYPISIPRNIAHKIRARLKRRSGDDTNGEVISSLFLDELGSNRPDFIKGDELIKM